MAEVITLADRRRPAADPFAEPCEVKRFDLGRRPVPAQGPTQEERIALLEEEVEKLRTKNTELLKALSRVLCELRGRRLAKTPATEQGAKP